MADILLIHGSCHGKWCWRDLIPKLRGLGHNATAIDLPGHGEDTTPLDRVTLDGYARAVVRAAAPGTVLVGHSMGGYAITAAAELAPERFAKLIYLCAYVPQNGLSLAQMRKLAPRQPLMPAVRMAADGLSFTVDPTMAPSIFYNGCTPDKVDYALARLGPQAVAPTNAPLTVTDRSAALPRHYIRCMQDRTVPPEFQMTMTAGWPAGDLQDMACGHSPFLSDPADLAARLNIALQD